MPTRTQLLERVRRAHTYQEIGEEFEIPPGQAYMIATGTPADGSDVLTREQEANRDGLVEGSTQHLVNPRTEMPKHQKTVEEWMRARVAADEAIRRAGEKRTATPPEIEGEGETNDVVSVIGWQHNQVKWLQEQLETVPGVKKGGDEAKQQQRVSILDMIRVRLSRHETAEEEYFWPAVREHLEGGDELADRALEQEQKGKDLLQELMGVSGGEEKFDDLVEELVAALRKHVAFEDTVLLRFKEKVPDEVRNQIGEKFQRAFEHAPTRPHPHAPNKAAPLKAAAKMAAPLDRARDAVGHRPAERQGQAEKKPANQVTRKKKGGK